MLRTYLFQAARIAAAIILLQTLYFKFTAAPESVWIFTQMKAEPFGRIGSGIVELVAVILLISGKYTRIGALVGALTMLGAIFSHIFVLGLEVQNDGGLLFALATLTFISCVYIVKFPLKRIEIKR